MHPTSKQTTSSSLSSQEGLLPDPTAAAENNDPTVPLIPTTSNEDSEYSNSTYPPPKYVSGSFVNLGTSPIMIHPTKGITKRWFARSSSLQPTLVPTKSGNISLSPWGIHWYTPASIILLLFIGLGSAIGHHAFYSSINGEVEEFEGGQEWTIRTGTGLAFLCRASLSAVVGISRKQWLWHTLSSKPVSLRGIDAMFGVSSDPFFFFNLELLRRARISTVMALIMWLIPISAIFTPGTIFVSSEPITNPTNCTVRSIRFPYETEESTLIAPHGQYLGTDLARKIFTIAAFSGKVTLNDTWDPYGTTLDDDCAIKCRYQVNFHGPTVKCNETRTSDIAGSPWQNTDQGGHDYLYRAGLSLRGSSILWIQYKYKSKDHIYRCYSSVSHYSVTHTIINRTFLQPNIKTFSNSSDQSHSGGIDTTNAFSTLDEILSGSISRFKTSSMGTVPARRGAPQTAPLLVNQTRVGSTPLGIYINTMDDIPKTTSGETVSLGQAIGSLVEKMVVSLLSEGSLAISANTTATCYSTKYINKYNYVARNLIYAYTSAFTAAVAATVLGFLALSRNGLARDANFSTILLATRNSDLDNIAVGACLGGNPVPDNIAKTKLMFGQVSGVRDGVGHAAVGIEGGVSLIQKRGWYS